MRLLLISTLALMGCGSDHDLTSLDDSNYGAQDEDDDNVTGENEGDPNAPQGQVTGRICDPSGDGYIGGARVWAVVGGEEFETFTDTDGYFTLTLPEGEYNIVAEKGSFSTSFDAVIVADEVTELAYEECLGGDVNIAVVTGNYDSIEDFLFNLEISYDLVLGEGAGEDVALFLDPARLATYDIIFVNCTTIVDWEPYATEMGNNLRAFVEGGGSLYASDYSYYVVEAAVPEAADFAGEDSWPNDGWGTGGTGEMIGNVASESLRTALGRDTIDVEFDTSWVSVDSAAGEVLIEGNYPTWDYGTQNGPVAFLYELGGGGRVLYTGFHNERQATADMEGAIREFVFSL